MVKITYYGHACFCLEHDGYRTVLDPYRHGMIPGLPELSLEAEAVLCSHTHDDHAFSGAVKLHDAGSAAYTLEEYPTPHDDQSGALRGWNVARIFDFGGIRVAHLGDIGCFPDQRLMTALRGIDCLLIPVGGTYTIDAAIAAEIVRKADPVVCIPMHYRTDTTGFGNISHIGEFISLFPDVRTAVNSIELTNKTQKQILILQYKP